MIKNIEKFDISPFDEMPALLYVLFMMMMKAKMPPSLAGLANKASLDVKAIIAASSDMPKPDAIRGFMAPFQSIKWAKKYFSRADKLLRDGTGEKPVTSEEAFAWFK